MVFLEFGILAGLTLPRRVCSAPREDFQRSLSPLCMKAAHPCVGGVGFCSTLSSLRLRNTLRCWKTGLRPHNRYSPSSTGITGTYRTSHPARQRNESVLPWRFYLRVQPFIRSRCSQSIVIRSVGMQSFRNAQNLSRQKSHRTAVSEGQPGTKTGIDDARGVPKHSFR